MHRRAEFSNLPKGYCSVKKLASGVLEVPYFWTIPGVRGHGTHYFKPGSPEYIAIINELGELEVGDEVTFVGPPTPEEVAITNSSETYEEAMARLRNEILEEQKEKESKPDQQ